MSLLTKVVRNVSRFRYRSQITHASASNSLQYSPKYFSVTPKLCIKMFLEHENKYAYDIMRNKGFTIDIENNKEYTTFDNDQFESILNQDWSKKSPAQLFEAFPKLGQYCRENKLCISDKMFDNYIDNLTDNIKKASDEELVSLFYALNLWPETASIRTRNFIEVWVALDDTCFSRLNNWSFDEMLSFIALFYMLNVCRMSDTSKKCLDKLASKAKRLTPQQLVQTLFFVGVQRNPPYDMHNLEIELEHNISAFSADDLAIMSMGFFKSKTPIRNSSLVLKMMEAVIADSKNIHEVSLAALLKVFRYSLRASIDECLVMIYKLLDTLQNEIPRLSIMCNVHIALLGTARLVLHKGCLNSIAEKVVSDVSNARLKDFERLVLSYGTFRYTPNSVENFFDVIMDELRSPDRNKEINQHGRSFAYCVQYLGLLSIYPVDLMSKVLSPKFLNHTYGKQCYAYGKEVLHINNTAEIFCNDKDMNRLTEKEMKILSKKYTEYMPTEEFKKQYNITEKMVIDVINVLREMRGGSRYVVGDHVVTHHQRGDIILCNNLEGTPIPVDEHFNSKSFGLIRKPPNKNIWVVLVVAGKNSIIYNTQAPTGPFQVKIEELRKLGYCSNLVTWSVYAHLNTIRQKADYLTKCINEAINNKEI